MSAIKLEKFGGMLPAWSDTNLPENQAALAINTYLFSGDLTGWRKPKFLRNLTNSAAQMVFRIPIVTKATATAVLTISTNAAEGDKVTVGEETYKFTATVTDAYDVLIGASANESAANLFAALTVGVGEGLLYGRATVANPDISIITADNTVVNNVITLKSPDFGAAYNNTPVSVLVGGARMSWAHATFTGGANEASDNRINAPSTWLEFLDQNTTIIKSQVVDDKFDRFYTASPSMAPQYNTRQRIQNNQPWWTLGVPAPGCAPGIDVTGGGDVASLGNVNTDTADIFHLNANTAYLLPIIPDGAMSLSDVTFNCQGADATVIHMAALLYSDNNGVPGSLLNTGDILAPSVTLGNVILTFLNPSGLTRGVQYWIGLIADQGMDIQQSNSLTAIPPGPAPVGYTFKAPFSSLPGAAPPVNTPVKVTSVTLIDKVNRIFSVGIDTPLAAVVLKYDTIQYGTNVTADGTVVGETALAFADAAIGATTIFLQGPTHFGCPAVGFAIADVTNPAAIKGPAVGGVSPPIDHQPNIQLWGDLTTSAILSARAYVYTYVTEYDEEGPPSPPTLINGWSNGTWMIDLFTPPPDDMGVVRNVTTLRLYRTISGQSGNTVYYFVAELPIGTQQYVDTVDDSIIALNNQMISTNWFSPPAALQGLLTLPNGIAVGWKANELWFSEPYRPHAWPAAYVLTTEYPIVGIGVSGQSVIVCTSAYPYVATGPSPSSMALTKILFPEPCIARCSVVSTDSGVYYQSPNGLIKVTQSGAATNTTELWITREKWKKLVPASASIQAIMQSSCYFAFGTSTDPDPAIAKQGYAIELNPADAQSFTIWPQPGGHRIGFCQLTSPNGYTIDNLILDQWTGVGIIVQNGQVWYYDFTDTQPEITPYKWRSKTFIQQTKTNYAAMKFLFDIPPGTPAQNPIRNEKPTTDASWNTLASDQYGIVRVYADDVLVTTREIRKSAEVMRILGGFKADQWEFEIEGRVSINYVQVATSVKGLAEV